MIGRESSGAGWEKPEWRQPDVGKRVVKSLGFEKDGR